MTLAAAFLGWMFDGFEMGLFPLVGRPALKDLLGKSGEAHVDVWFGLMIAGFLVGAASGGVLFGWLGDRLGRVRAMSLSVLTYAVFMGLCGMADSPAKVFVFRFISSLGMGGEWSLGVALVMEIWPDKSRGMLAGLIGAASNVGFLSIALVGLVLGRFIDVTQRLLLEMGLQKAWVDQLGRPFRLAADDADRGSAGVAHVFYPDSGARIASVAARKTPGIDLVLVGPRFVGGGRRHLGAAGNDRVVAAGNDIPAGIADRGIGCRRGPGGRGVYLSRVSLLEAGRGRVGRLRIQRWPDDSSNAAGGVFERCGVGRNVGVGATGSELGG